MALSSFTVTIITKSDSPFNIIENAPIEIRERLANGSSGNLSLIFSDSAGLNPITQVGFAANSLGQATFFAAAADYNAVYDNNGTPVTIAVDVGVTGGILDERFDRLNPATLAIWQADPSAQLDDVVTTKERVATFGGGAIGDVIATGTANGTKIVAHNTLPLSWELRVNSTTTVLEMGAVPDATGVAGVGTDNTAAFQDLADLGLPIQIPIGKFRITAAINRGNATWIGKRHRSTSLDIGSEIVCDDSIFTGRFIISPLEIRDILFTGTSKAGTCLSVENINPVNFHGWSHYENVRIRGFDLGVFIGNSFITNFDSVLIEENNKGMDVKPNDFVTTLYFNDVVMRENSIYALDFDSPTKAPNIHFTNWNVENNGASGTFQVKIKNADPCIFQGGYIENEPGIPALISAGGNFISTKSWFVSNTGGIDFGTGTFTGDFNRIKMTGASPGVIKANGGSNQVLEFKNSSILFDGAAVPSLSKLKMISTQADGVVYSNYEVGSGVDFRFNSTSRMKSISAVTFTHAGTTIVAGSAATLVSNVAITNVMEKATAIASFRDLFNNKVLLQVTTASTNSNDFYSIIGFNLAATDFVIPASTIIDITFFKHNEA